MATDKMVSNKRVCGAELPYKFKYPNGTSHKMCLAGEGERGGGESTIRKIDFYAFLHLASVLYSYILNRVLFGNLNYLNSSFTLECCQDVVISDEVGLSIH